MRLWPPASTATVPVARLARWAAASMPRARPDTTTRPASPSSREPAGELDAGRRGVAGPDHGDHRAIEDRQMSAHRDEWRGIVDHLQAPRIAGLAQRQQAHTRGPRRLD